jgi:hypothetical protein
MRPVSKKKSGSITTSLLNSKSQTPLPTTLSRVTTVYATEYSGASVRGACTRGYRLPTLAIKTARARHRMYPVSSPIGFYGPYGPTQRLQGLERLSVRSTGCACASQTADPLPELRGVLLFRPCQVSIYLGLGTYGASFSALSLRMQ